MIRKLKKKGSKILEQRFFRDQFFVKAGKKQ